MDPLGSKEKKLGTGWDVVGYKHVLSYKRFLPDAFVNRSWSGHATPVTLHTHHTLLKHLLCYVLLNVDTHIIHLQKCKSQH